LTAAPNQSVSCRPINANRVPKDAVDGFQSFYLTYVTRRTEWARSRSKLLDGLTLLLSKSKQ
ncbi:MAG: hypothetical protein Q4E55_06865, partial [Bacteroidales bacterium]|nr:hypothetical protein [Bacteroidales bacterium]